MAEHNQLGDQGEELAKRYLQEKGYEILEVNWRKRKFEIDIIAQEKEEIVFVEVKTRSTLFFGDPEEAVTLKKQQHLIEGADCYAQEKQVDLNCRFDIVAVVFNENEREVKHIKDAFSPSF